MLAREIFNAALRLLAESSVAQDVADYEERAPYLLAVFCTDAAEYDASLRRFSGIEESSGFDGIYIPLENEFPLLDRLSSPALLYLAAMLVLEDDGELSDKLYDKYSDAMASIYNGMCGVSQTTQNKYFTD